MVAGARAKDRNFLYYAYFLMPPNFLINSIAFAINVMVPLFLYSFRLIVSIIMVLLAHEKKVLRERVTFSPSLSPHTC